MTSTDDLASPNNRRDVLMGTASLVLLTGATMTAVSSSNAIAQSGPSASLYERLGGIFAIAAVVNYFSDQIIENPVAGRRSKNAALREWHTKSLARLPGLKFMRTLWVASVSGGPFTYAPTKPGADVLGLENAHKNLKIAPHEFDAVAGVLAASLDHFKVPEREKKEVLAAFAAHKNEVTEGWRISRKS